MVCGSAHLSKLAQRRYRIAVFLMLLFDCFGIMLISSPGKGIHPHSFILINP